MAFDLVELMFWNLNQLGVSCLSPDAEGVRMHLIITITIRMAHLDIIVPNNFRCRRRFMLVLLRTSGILPEMGDPSLCFVSLSLYQVCEIIFYHILSINNTWSCIYQIDNLRVIDS